MAEVFRIEIPVQVMDQTNPGLNNAAKRVNNFEVSIRRTKKQLEEMNQTRWQLTLYALDRTQQTLNRVRSSLFGVVGRTWNISVGILGAPLRMLNSIKNTLLSFPSLIAALGTGIAVQQGMISPMKMADELTRAKIGFNTFLGEERGGQFMQDVRQFAVNTPFGERETRDMAIRLLPTFKEDPNMIFRTLTSFGDAASLTGAGTEGMKLALLGFRQIGAVGKLTMEELRQVTENLMVPLDPIVEELGIAKEDLSELGAKGIPAAKAMEAILSALERDVSKGGFARGMSAIMETLLQQASIFRDTMQIKFIERWGKGLESVAIPALKDLNAWFDQNEETVERWGMTLESAGRTLGTNVVNGISWVKNKVVELTSSQEWKEAGTLGDKISASMNFMTNEGLFRSAGEFLGGVLKGGIMTALGILDPSGSVDDSTFVGAGQRAGKSFMDGFLAEFDAGEVTKKFGEVVKNTVVPSSDKSLLGNIAGLGGGVLAGGWLLSKLFPMLKWAGPVGGAIGGGMLGSQLGGSMFGDQGEAWGGVLGGLAGGALLSGPFLKRVPGWIKKGIGRKAAPKLPTATPTPLEVGPRTSVPILGPDGKPIKNVLQDPTTSSTRPPNLKNEGLGAPSTKPGFLKSVIRSPYLKGFGLAGSVIGGAQILMADSTADRGAGIGSMTGTLLGGAIGTLAGPIGTAIGSAAGGFLGNWLGGKIGGLFENDPIPVQAPTEHKISITVNTEPRFDIQTAANAGDVLNIIRSNLREVGNVISGELAERIEESYNNMA